MGIKERERRVEVFFHGLFMDEDLLRGKGLEPEGGEIAAIDGFALRIGQRAALVPTPGAKVYGLVFSLTRSELGGNRERPDLRDFPLSSTQTNHAGQAVPLFCLLMGSFADSQT